LDIFAEIKFPKNSQRWKHPADLNRTQQYHFQIQRLVRGKRPLGRIAANASIDLLPKLAAKNYASKIGSIPYNEPTLYKDIPDNMYKILRGISMIRLLQHFAMGNIS